MSYDLPDDWFIEESGESLILDQEKVVAELTRLKALINQAIEWFDGEGMHRQADSLRRDL